MRKGTEEFTLPCAERGAVAEKISRKSPANFTRVDVHCSVASAIACSGMQAH